MRPHKQAMLSAIMIACILACPQFIQTTHAYTHYHCGGDNIEWPSSSISWRAGANSFPSGSPRRTALTSANQRWNEAPSTFTFSIHNWGDTNLGRGNDQNEMWFSTNAGLLDGAPARCFTWTVCSAFSDKITEADIVFNANVAWSTSTDQTLLTPYGGSRRPWATTAIHEMGHALGLAHEDDTYNVMGQDWDHIHVNDGRVRWYPGEDAGNGASHLYMPWPPFSQYKDDLGVVHWKHTGHSGEYSTHGPCQIYKLDDTPVTSEAFNGWVRYKVQAGKIYRVQWTYENNGFYNKTGVNVAYYVSSNDKITTADRLIGLGTFTMKRNKPFTHAINLLMPEDLTIGQTYYLGAIVDYTNSIPEYCETNNATWIPIRMIKEIIFP